MSTDALTTPAPVDLPPNATRAAAGIALVLVAQLMLILDATVVNVALPHIDDALETIQTNLVGTIRLIDAFLPRLLTRPAATVMTVSSGLAFVPLTATPTYSATKAGVHSYTQALRQQPVVDELVDLARGRGLGEQFGLPLV